MPRRRPARSAANPTRSYAAAAAGASTTATRRAKRTTGKTTSRGARRPLPASRRSSARRRGACRARPSRGPSTSAWAPGCVIGRAAGRTSAKRASGAGPRRAPARRRRRRARAAARRRPRTTRRRSRGAARAPNGGAEDAIYVLGATFLYGLRRPAPAARGRPQAAAQADRGRRGGRRGAELLHRRGELRRRASAAPEVRDVARQGRAAAPARRRVRPGARRPEAHGIMYEAGDEGPKDGKEAARLAALAADAGLRDAKRTLARMYVDGEHVPRDPEKAARLIGLERTADLWRDGEGPKAPGFLFSAPRPDGEAEASRPIAKDGGRSPAEMDRAFGPEGGDPRSARSNHRVVCSSTKTSGVSYTQAERATDRGKMTPSLSLSLERRDPATRATTKTGEGDSAPHKHAVAARPSTRPAGAAVHALFERRARRPPIIPQTPQPSSHSKNNTRRERIAQGPGGPGPARPRRPLHIIQVERPANKAAPPKREADAVYPPQHTRSALKNMSVERRKARPAVRGPLEQSGRRLVHSQSPNPAHTQPHISQQTLDDGERRASRPLRRKTPPLAPPRRPPGEKDHPSPRRSRAQSAPRRDQRLSHHSHKRAATAPRASSSRTAFRPPSRRAAAEQSRFGPRAAPPGVRHAGRPAGPRAVCGVCGGRADPGTQSAPPGARPGRRASAPQVARLGVEKRLLRGAAGRAQRRAAPGRRRRVPRPARAAGAGLRPLAARTAAF